MRKTIFFAVLIALVSCSHEHSSDVKNVFDEDNRIKIDTSIYPFGQIGQLSTRCTATVIDSNMLLSAAHCIPKGPAIDKPFKFYLNRRGPKISFTATINGIWTGWDNDSSKARGNDWALLRTKEDLSKYARPVPLIIHDLSTMYGTKIKNVGYGSKFHGGVWAGYDPDCYITNANTGRKNMYYTDCDIERGHSGGPILDERNNIIGILVAEFRDGEESLKGIKYSDDKANVFIGLNDVYKKFLSLKGISVPDTKKPGPPKKDDPTRTEEPTYRCLPGKEGRYTLTVNRTINYPWQIPIKKVFEKSCAQMTTQQEIDAIDRIQLYGTIKPVNVQLKTNYKNIYNKDFDRLNVLGENFYIPDEFRDDNITMRLNGNGKISLIGIRIDKTDIKYRRGRTRGKSIVTCESKKRATTFCAIEGAHAARVKKQLSSSECKESRFWTNTKGLFVTRGCRAEFEITYYK